MGKSQSLLPDSIPKGTKHSSLFSDSTVARIKSRKLTRLIYEGIMVDRGNPDKVENARLEQYEALYRLQGRTINSIRINRLDAFGPTLEDTAFVNPNNFVKWANNLHAKSSLGNIERNIFLRSGDRLDPEQILENERLIRQMEYIKDARILASVDALDSTKVNLVVITKDVFSYGVDAQIGGLEDGYFALFNQNTWGIGHELYGGPVWNTQAHDGLGFKTSYTARNILGSYTDAMMGYVNSYRQEGVAINIERPFAKISNTWGGGLDYYRMFRTNSYYETNMHLDLNTSTPINYWAIDWWAGHAFKLGMHDEFGSQQLVVSGRYRKVNFMERPQAGNDGNQFFADSELYMMSFSLLKRMYLRDNHIYGYGITEDIPKGYLHELVLGYDNNEFNRRLYSHLYLSTGNLLSFRPSYFFLSGGFGTFFDNRKMEQGEIQVNANLITRQFELNNHTVRQFFSASYIQGVNRFEQEYLELDDANGIRGFQSNLIAGQKKLNVQTETLYFLPRKYWGFNIAFFDFIDVGILAGKNQMLARGRWYTGFGGGIRFKNESLVFETIQIRLAFYPWSPADQSFWGMQGGYLRNDIPYNFQARKPNTLEYR
ncbi:MAG: hypothetical protein ACK5LR_03760 [Mangrovibacterium sp.]